GGADRARRPLQAPVATDRDRHHAESPCRLILDAIAVEFRGLLRRVRWDGASRPLTVAREASQPCAALAERPFLAGFCRTGWRARSPPARSKTTLMCSATSRWSHSGGRSGVFGPEGVVGT